MANAISPRMMKTHRVREVEPFRDDIGNVTVSVLC